MVFLCWQISLTSSSAIENEHVVWFFIASSWYSLLFLLALRDSSHSSNVSGKTEANSMAWEWKSSQLSRRLVGIGLILILLRVLRCRLQVINFARLVRY